MLVLWRDETDECGYLLLRRGRPADAHVWNSSWQVVGDDPGLVRELVGPPGDAQRLMTAFGRADLAVELGAAALHRRPGAAPR